MCAATARDKYDTCLPYEDLSKGFGALAEWIENMEKWRNRVTAHVGADDLQASGSPRLRLGSGGPGFEFFHTILDAVSAWKRRNVSEFFFEFCGHLADRSRTNDPLTDRKCVVTAIILIQADAHIPHVKDEISATIETIEDFEFS